MRNRRDLPRTIPGRGHFLCAALLAMAACASSGQGSDLPPPADPAGDDVVRSAPVPSAWFPQAEVRLVRRDGAAVLQTVIVSPLFERVVAEIRKKESSAWPPGRPGHADAVRYAEALDRARRAVERRAREGGARGDRRRKLLIEFVLEEEASFVALYEPEVGGEFGELRITGRRLLERLPLSRRYVRENLFEIAADSLGLGRRETEEALKPFPRPSRPSEEPRTGPAREEEDPR